MTPPTSTDKPYSDDLLQRAHRTFVGFFQGLFWSRPPGQFMWSPSEELTEIYISGDNEPPQGRYSPAVHVTQGPASWAGQSIDTSTDRSIASNSHTFYDGVRTTIIVSCVAEGDVPTRYLGWLCFRSLAAHKQIIQARGTVRAIHNQFQMSSVISADLINKAYNGKRAVQIVVPIEMQCEFTIADANNDYKATLDKITTRMTQV